eukprot:1154595-Pelagomonas_calceolata.AAC.6
MLARPIPNNALFSIAYHSKTSASSVTIARHKCIFLAKQGCQACVHRKEDHANTSSCKLHYIRFLLTIGKRVLRPSLKKQGPKSSGFGSDTDLQQGAHT